MGLWAKSVIIFNSLREHGKQSIRSLADRTGLSKSSVHRHLQAMDRRDRYPESSLWETEAGRTWLIRLMVATLFVFGLKRGVGAETLSEFLGLSSPGCACRVLAQRLANRHAHAGAFSLRPLQPGRKTASPMARYARSSGPWTRPFCSA